MRQVLVVLPLPRRELSPNARVHWRVKSRAVKAYRTLAWAVARDATGGKPPRWARARASARFFFVDQRNRDRDNMQGSLKAAFDGIADAGVVANDAGLEHDSPEVLVDRERPRVEITLTEVA